MDIRFLFLSAAISSLAITPAVAQAATCDDPIIAQKIFDRRAKKGPMPTAHARIINIQLGADDLSRVQQDLGESEPLARQEHAPVRVCYTSLEPDGPVILFEAGALGGWRRLTAFCVVTGPDAAVMRSHCKATSKITSELMTDGGLRAGQTLAKTRAMLGKPTLTKTGKDNYWFSTRTPQNADLTEYIGISRLGEKVVGFKVSRVESN